MKKGKILAIFAVLALFASLGMSTFVHAEDLDESQTIISQQIDVGYGAAQSFKTNDPYIYQVDFYFAPGSEVSQIHVRIDNDLNASNGQLAEKNFNISGWSAGWHTWSLRNSSADLHVTPGTTYYLEILPFLPPTTSSPVWYGSNSDPYSKGQAYRYDASGNATTSGIPGYDYAFKIYGDVNPVASYTYSTSNLTLYVNASGSYAPDGDPIIQYRWDWDGDSIYDNTSASPTANHTYGVQGNYTVILQVVDEDSHSDTETKIISIPNHPPVASFTYSLNGSTVTVNASASTDSDGNITTYSWDWESDGTYDDSFSTPIASHTYTTYGTYTITLKVTDNSGNTDTTTNAGGGFVIENPHHQIWKMPFSWFEMATMIFIGVFGIAFAAFFLKPESIKAIGYAPALGTMLVTGMMIGAILMYHAGIAWYWILGVVLLMLFILYVTIKVVAIKKKKLVKSVFKHRKIKRRR